MQIDEMESLSSAHTRSIIYDVSKLDEPKLMRFFRSEKQAVDHNNYVFTRPGVQAEFISQVSGPSTMLFVCSHITFSRIMPLVCAF